MRLFISYSTGDLEIVDQIADALRPHADVFYWDKDKEPGEDSWQTIFGWIDAADLVIAVITDRTVSRAMSVGNEIGHARARRKKIIPLVSSEVPESELGCLKGVTYRRISRENIGEMIPKIAALVRKLKQKKEAQDRFLLTILGILGLIALFSGGDEDEDDF